MSLWLKPLETLCNNALRYDRQTQNRLDALIGKSLLIATTEPELAFLLAVSPSREGARLVLTSERPSHPSAQITGRSADLLALLQAQDVRQSLMTYSLNIQGDTQVFFQWQNILAQLDVDWELALGDRLGDLPAHWLAESLGFVGRQMREKGRSWQRTHRNFLREEANWLVPSELGQQQSEHITNLQRDTQRLASKVAQLEQQQLKRQRPLRKPS